MRRLVIVALLCAGCGSAATEPATDSGTTTPSKAVQFSQCMRDNGVKAFPDPDASGSLTLDGVVNGSSLDTGSATWKAALSACKDLQPAGFTGHKRSAAQQDAALTFAQCIRDNGVKDFPDPSGDGPLVDTRKIPSTDRPGGMETLNAAMDTCGEAAERALDDR